MPCLVHTVPVFASRDVAESIAFYVEKLGFREVLNHEGEYGIVARDGIEIHLRKCEDHEVSKNTSCRISVEGINDLYAELDLKGVVHPNRRLEDKTWGAREFSALDVDGNLIIFSTPQTESRKEREPARERTPQRERKSRVGRDFVKGWKRLNRRSSSASN